MTTKRKIDADMPTFTPDKPDPVNVALTVRFTQKQHMYLSALQHALGFRSLGDMIRHAIGYWCKNRGQEKGQE